MCIVFCGKSKTDKKLWVQMFVPIVLCGFHCAEHCYCKNTALMFFSSYADPDVFVQEVFADNASKNIAWP